MIKNVLIGILVLVLILLGGEYLVRKNSSNSAIQPTSQNEPTPSRIPELDPSVTLIPTVSESGTIQGSLSYPSEGIPEDLLVCAEDLETGEKFCTQQKLSDPKYQYGKGYQVHVPPGDYHVYALLGSNIDHRAYYSEFVTCGLLAACPSHTPIAVKIQAGQIVTDINPHDWYTP